jgi:hypothetical protein
MAADPSQIPIPERVEDLDLSWFRAALGPVFPASEITEARILEVIPGTCTKIRVGLGGEGEPGRRPPPTVLVKGGFAEHSHQFLGMHETEMRYYRDIAPRTRFDTPECYFAGQDAETGRSLVVLEDLDRRGVRWLDALAPLDWADEVRFVDALAAFAAQWWESSELSPGGRLDWVITSYEREAADYIGAYLAPETWARFLRLPRCAALPRSLHDRDRMARALGQLKRRLEVQPRTLSHGDTHLGNLYLSSDGAPGFLDAQPRAAPWVKDFAYQLIAALDIENRRAWERPLLARYLRDLRKAGVEAPSFEEAWFDYRCEAVYGLFIFMINESRFQREETNTAFAARFGAAVLDHDALALLR